MAVNLLVPFLIDTQSGLTLMLVIITGTDGLTCSPRHRGDEKAKYGPPISVNVNVGERDLGEVWLTDAIDWPWFVPSSTQLANGTYVHCKNLCVGGSTSGKTKHQISYKPYEPLVYTCHDAKNMKLNRPMSPHLTVYAPTLPAMTSIVQRATGIILTAYALLMAFGSLFLSNGVETYVSIIQSLDLSRPSIFLIKIILGAPFTYHYFNGIRFCMWNAGKWLDIKQVYSTARTSFIATGVLTLLFALL